MSLNGFLEDNKSEENIFIMDNVSKLWSVTRLENQDNLEQKANNFYVAPIQINCIDFEWIYLTVNDLLVRKAKIGQRWPCRGIYPNIKM